MCLVGSYAVLNDGRIRRGEMRCCNRGEAACVCKQNVGYGNKAETNVALNMAYLQNTAPLKTFRTGLDEAVFFECLLMHDTAIKS